MDRSIDTLIEELKAYEEDSWETLLTSLWMSGVPLNANDDKDGDKDGDDSDDDEEETSDDDDDDDEDEDPKESKKARKLAHEKLRASEAREKAANKKIADLERKGLSTADAEKARADAAEEKVKAFEEKEARVETEKDIARIAKKLKFINPLAAKRFVDKGVTEEREIRAALAEAIEDFPTLIGDGSPPPPVNESKDKAASTNSGMNNAIRQAAGRT